MLEENNIIGSLEQMIKEHKEDNRKYIELTIEEVEYIVDYLYQQDASIETQEDIIALLYDQLYPY